MMKRPILLEASFEKMMFLHLKNMKSAELYCWKNQQIIIKLKLVAPEGKTVSVGIRWQRNIAKRFLKALLQAKTIWCSGAKM